MNENIDSIIKDRVINFGKYKGTPIKKLIIEHIGYIYWCLSNIKWFKLNTDEQELFIGIDEESCYSQKDEFEEWLGRNHPNGMSNIYKVTSEQLFN